MKVRVDLRAVVSTRVKSVVCQVFPDLLDVPEGARAEVLNAAARGQPRLPAAMRSMTQLAGWTMCVGIAFSPAALAGFGAPSVSWSSMTALLVAGVVFCGYMALDRVHDLRRAIRLGCIRAGVQKCVGCGYVLDEASLADRAFACPECGGLVGGGANDQRSTALLSYARVVKRLDRFMNADRAAAAVELSLDRYPAIRSSGTVAMGIVVVEMAAFAGAAKLMVNPAGPGLLMKLSFVGVAAMALLAWRWWCMRTIQREVDGIAARGDQDVERQRGRGGMRVERSNRWVEDW